VGVVSEKGNLRKGIPLFLGVLLPLCVFLSSESGALKNQKTTPDKDAENDPQAHRAPNACDRLYVEVEEATKQENDT
jgi:hypothetical protein